MDNNLQNLFFHRLKNLYIMVGLLRLAPFVRCVILNGSMAEDLPYFLCHSEQVSESTRKRSRNKFGMTENLGQHTWHIKPSSDIDLLIIAKSGRIYTCRIAILFLAYISGLKRSNSKAKTHAGRFCFNYFLTDKFLTVPHNRGEKVDKYCAENYSKSILIWGDQKLFERFMNVNLKWMEKYIDKNPNYKLQLTNKFPASPAGGQNPYFKMTCHSELVSGSHHRLPRFFQSLAMTDKRSIAQNVIEKILSGRLGGWIELFLKNIQLRRIRKDPAVKKYPEYIAFNDRELRFHLPDRLKNERTEEFLS